MYRCILTARTSKWLGERNRVVRAVGVNNEKTANASISLSQCLVAGCAPVAELINNHNKYGSSTDDIT